MEKEEVISIIKARLEDPKRRITLDREKLKPIFEKTISDLKATGNMHTNGSTEEQIACIHEIVCGRATLAFYGDRSKKNLEEFLHDRSCDLIPDKY